MSELVPEESNELSQEGKNRPSLVRRVLRGGHGREQEEEYEDKSYWSDTDKDWRESEEWEKWREEHYGDPWGASMALREKKREEERRTKPKDQSRSDPIPKPDFTYGAVKRQDACPRPQEGDRQAIDLQQSYFHPSAYPFPMMVRDLENQESEGADSKNLLENPLHRLLALEEREQELEKKKEELGKAGCLLENNLSDEGGENPHGEID